MDGGHRCFCLRKLPKPLPTPDHCTASNPTHSSLADPHTRTTSGCARNAPNVAMPSATLKASTMHTGEQGLTKSQRKEIARQRCLRVHNERMQALQGSLAPTPAVSLHPGPAPGAGLEPSLRFSRNTDVSIGCDADPNVDLNASDKMPNAPAAQNQAFTTNFSTGASPNLQTGCTPCDHSASPTPTSNLGGDSDAEANGSTDPNREANSDLRLAQKGIPNANLPDATTLPAPDHPKCTKDPGPNLEPSPSSDLEPVEHLSPSASAAANVPPIVHHGPAAHSPNGTPTVVPATAFDPSSVPDPSGHGPSCDLPVPIKPPVQSPAAQGSPSTARSTSTTAPQDPLQGLSKKERKQRLAAAARQRYALPEGTGPSCPRSFAAPAEQTAVVAGREEGMEELLERERALGAQLEALLLQLQEQEQT